jgi:transposase
MQFALSTARVMPPVYRFQPFLGDMSIYLRRRNIRMPQQHLHDAQVGAVVQQVAGKGMPQEIGRAHV